MTVREAADDQRISQMTVLRLIRSGRLVGAYRVGRQWRIPESSWLAFLAAAQVAPDGGETVAAQLVQDRAERGEP